MTITGTAHVFPRAHINTDEIIPARHLNVHDEAALAPHVLEDLDPGFVARVAPGDFIIAGEDFGCGSSREHAVWALRGAGVGAVLAASFARIFFRNAINNGFLALECPAGAGCATTGDLLELDVESGLLRNLTAGTEERFLPVSAFARELLDAGGLLPWVLSRRAAAEGTP